MTTTELVALVRLRLDDTVAEYRVSDAQILQALNLAQDEFARQTLCVFSETDGDITADDPWLAIPANLVLVKTVVLNDLQLRPILLHELDFGYYTFNGTENSGRFGAWRAEAGTPKFVITDMRADSVRLVPIPTADAVPVIEGYGLPAALVLPAVGVDEVNPEIPVMFQEELIYGALVRLYSMEDVDVQDVQQTQLYDMRWQKAIATAQMQFRTDLRRQTRVMELSRGFSFVPTAEPAKAQ